MNKILASIVVFLFCINAQAQKEIRVNKKIDGNGNQVKENGKSTGNNKVNTDASHYKFISIDKDTTLIDTTLSIKKEYKFNYLRKDYFELLPFSNTGQVFNELAYNFTESQHTFSRFGSRAKHVAYDEVRDVKYYEVATPLTELLFKTTMEQGQLADGFFTINTTPRFNFSLAYQGLRSLGKYRHIKANSGKLRATANYRTKNDRYFIRAHMLAQTFENEENGGIVDGQVVDFENGNSEFRDRSRFDVNFEDASNKLSAKRFYLNHYYDVFKKQDSTSNYALSVGHVANLEDKKYQFNQTTANAYFGDAFTSNISDEVRLERFYTEGYLSFFRKDIGAITAKIGFTDYNYGYNSIVNLNNNIFIPNRIKNDFLSYGFTYKNKLKRIMLQANFNSNITKDHQGSYLDGKIGYNIYKDVNLEGEVVVKATLPDFNYRLYQSDYKNYNWYNENLETIKSKAIIGKLSSEKYKATIQASYTTIQNHTYFGIDAVTNSVKPFQSANSINYLKVFVNKEFNLGRFGLDNRLQYQSVNQDSDILNVPELIARSTLYYTNTFFRKNLYLQTGLIGSYFTKYKMNAYDPLLGEFYTQTAKEYGGFPRLDFFVNAKVRNARIYFKIEHFNSGLTGNNFYSAPNYPYKDRIIRFGLIWDFFL
ncbi:putative porin [Pseudofulvibacter geojedonensis]|uniref:Porin n=1 Tax=Pseudofulvibacter geojedonensis TaxID=1123758 RepID=A0ABW3I5M3_9FLAO